MLVGNCLLQSGRINKGILGSVAFRNDGDNGEHVTIGMYFSTFFGLQANGVVDRLVADNFVCTDVNETDGFGSRDNSGHLFIHS